MACSIRPVLLGLLLAANIICSASASDWLQFRGPTGQGLVSTGQFPMKWSATENVVWRRELPGQGWSSPIVAGDAIYLTAAVPLESIQPSFELVLFILDAKSGQVRRKQSLFTHQGELTAKMHAKNSQASPTPLCDLESGKIYLHFGHLGTACTDLKGEGLWRNDQLGYAPVHGNGGSPVLVGDLLIFSRDGESVSEVLALDTGTGNIRWQRQRNVEADKRFSFCTPLVIEAAGKQQLIIPGSNIVQSLNPVNGEVHWHVNYDGYSVIPRPIYANGLVFVCTGYNRPSLLAIDPTGSGDVTKSHLRWKVDANVPHTPSLLAHEGKILMISDKGIASSVDARSGKEIWKERIGGNFSASPLLRDNRLWMISEEGDSTMLEIGEQPTILAKNKLGERCLATPAMLSDDMLIRSANALYRIRGN